MRKQYHGLDNGHLKYRVSYRGISDNREWGRDDGETNKDIANRNGSIMGI